MTLGVVAVVAVVGGFLLMWPLAWLFGVMGWPLFHGWGLAHGSFVIAWPLLSGLVFLLGWLLVRSRDNRSL
jgi:hypothetical protein